MGVCCKKLPMEEESVQMNVGKCEANSSTTVCTKMLSQRQILVKERPYAIYNDL